MEVGPNLTNISVAQSKHFHFKGGREVEGIRKKTIMKIRLKSSRVNINIVNAKSNIWDIWSFDISFHRLG